MSASADCSFDDYATGARANYKAEASREVRISAESIEFLGDR